MESRKEHTPGPLEAMVVTLAPKQAELFRAGTEHVAVVDARGDATALCGPASDSRSRADARLYAASPRLLQALREIVADVERAISDGADITGYVGTSKATSAIAQAEGR